MKHCYSASACRVCKTCFCPQQHQQTLGLSAEPPVLALGKHRVIFNYYTRGFWITHPQIQPAELLLWSLSPRECTKPKRSFPPVLPRKAAEVGAHGLSCVVVSWSSGRELLLGWEKILLHVWRTLLDITSLITNSPPACAASWAFPSTERKLKNAPQVTLRSQYSEHDSLSFPLQLI